jgi:hypothetical protein
LAASGVSVVGLAAALALSVPTAANAQHRVDHNCGNFDHTDPTFGAPYDGHHRHRGAFHPVGYRIDAPVDPRDDDGADHHDADDPIGHHGDNNADHDGDRDTDQNRDADHHGEHEADHRDQDGAHHGDRDTDHHGDHHGDRDNRDGDERDSAYHGTWNGNGGGGDEGSYNCDNFDHRGKQMHIPPGLFDDADGPRR